MCIEDKSIERCVLAQAARSRENPEPMANEPMGDAATEARSGVAVVCWRVCSSHHACALSMLEECSEEEPVAHIVARARERALCSLSAVTGGAPGDDPPHVGLEKNLFNRPLLLKGKGKGVPSCSTDTTERYPDDFLLIELPHARMQSREALTEIVRTKEPTVDIRRSRPLGIIAFGLAA